MVKLDKMQVAGFKSFSDRTEIRFPDGITAVVGPNGCGKSNIGDAINWVLGEQSAKLLRGSQMQDVIFSGTEARKATGMAEVSLHLSSTNGSPGPSRRTMVLTRRLFRSGESEYLLDGRRCRLKDIQELLRNEHVGAKTYATIEQGRIDQILNARPKDRRMLIEDAAGVSGFKHKRRLAELKLEATEANLLRVQDVVIEVRRQINSLKRQAAKARRYQRLRDDLRFKERLQFGRRARDMDAELAKLRAAEIEAREVEASSAAGLATSEAKLEEERHALEEAERAARRASEDLHRLELEIDREESGIRHGRERIANAEEASRRARDEATQLSTRRDEERARTESQAAAVGEGARDLEAVAGRRASSQNECEAAGRRVTELREGMDRYRNELFGTMNEGAECRNRRRALEEAIERNVADAARLRDERDEAVQTEARLVEETTGLDREVNDHRRSLDRLRTGLEGLETELRAARERLAADQERLARAREAVQSAVARLATLEDVTSRFAGVSDGVRMLLSEGPSIGLRTHGVVADYVEAGRDIEAAAEAYLQAVLPTVIVEDEADVCRGAEVLRGGEAGRATLLCRNHPAGGVAVGVSASGSPPAPEEILADPHVDGRLRDRLGLSTSLNGVLQDRIGDAILVDSLENALALHRRYPAADYVTRAGEVVYASGLVAAGGKATADTGLLAHNRLVHETEARLTELRQEIRESERSVEDGRTAVSRLEAKVIEDRRRLEQAGHRRVELELRARQSAEERARTGRRAEVLKAELDNFGAELARLRDELTETVRTVAEAEERHADLEGRLAEDGTRLEQLETDLAQRSEEVASLRAEEAARRQVQEAAARELERLETSVAELDARIEALASDAAAADAQARAESALLEKTESELADHVRARGASAASLSEMEAATGDMRLALAERDAEVRTSRAGLEDLREKVRAAEIARSRSEADRQHLDELCYGELGVDAEDAAKVALEAGGDLDAVDLESIQGEIAELRGKLEKVGPVNMMAIDEFTELEERYTFLTTQKDDLEKSMVSLKETIRKINRTSRERFVAAFEEVRSHYKEIFQVLFNGGRADLRLEEGEDVLESGIEVLAQPPGKRLTNIQLLSGGEKAMSAIALLFAIFRFRPSPFCLLDEVDAALDDTNVGRFTRMLREYAAQTQFVLITHNKVSMESANLLYGVTMEQPGISKLVSLQLG
jgi:chromosome segregation protein